MEVRDVIHGAIRLSPAETAVVDNPFVQRLRNIKQTGFSHLPFPGATHSRYSHCLGVMYLAGVAFDSVFRDWVFKDEGKRHQFREVVRMAAMCHDIGHAPYSHSTEFAMPSISALGLTWYDDSVDIGQRATHEDYTIAILERTSICELIDRNFPFTSKHVASLISTDIGGDDDFWLDGGLDYRRVLSQLISSELDVDRLDYLVRDSYYSGARYGMVDVPWLVSSLTAISLDGVVTLGLDRAAIYAFDDFMIARHHMFLMVYFHHKSVIYEELLKRFVTSPDTDFRLPGDLDEYLTVDDPWMEYHLRQSDNEWAKRFVQRDTYRRILERHGDPGQIDLSKEAELLDDAGIDVIQSRSTGKLSRYNVFGQKREKAASIQVIERVGGHPVEAVQTLSQATQVFQRYADARRIERLYVAPEDVERARGVLGLPT